MVLHSNFSQFLLFSESPMMLPNFLNHCIILQVPFLQVDNQKRFREYSYPLVYFAAFYQNWSVSQDLGRFFESSIKSIPFCSIRIWSRNKLIVRDSWSRCIEYSTFVLNFLLRSSVFSILQFLGNFLRCILVNTVLHLQFTTQVYYPRWAWSAHWLASSNCRLWDWSSRRDSINEYS